MSQVTFGAFVPQGWKMELVSIPDPPAKWAKTLEIAAWAEHTRAAWEHRLDRLDAHLRRTSDRTASPPTLEQP